MPRTQIAPTLHFIGEVSVQYGLTITNIFHAGDGNMHPITLFDARKPGEMKRRGRRAERSSPGAPPPAARSRASMASAWRRTGRWQNCSRQRRWKRSELRSCSSTSMRGSTRGKCCPRAGAARRSGKRHSPRGAWCTKSELLDYSQYQGPHSRSSGDRPPLRVQSGKEM